MSSATTTSTTPAPGVEKKKPGRPKKRPAFATAGVSGISANPKEQENILELAYINPTMFKKIFQLFKTFGVNEININFEPAGATIAAVDHFEKSNIFAVINGARMSHYYCKETIKITVQRINIEKILSALGKTNTRIMFILKGDYRSVLHVIVHDSEYNSEDTYDVEVACRTDGEIEQTDDSEYPICFKMNAKNFKTKINNIRRLSPALTIQKCGDEALQLTFDKAQNVNWISVYNDNNRIALRSTLDKEDILSISVMIDHILPFCNSCIGDEIIFRADKQARLSMSTYLDGTENDYGAIVRVFTEIRDCKKD